MVSSTSSATTSAFASATRYTYTPQKTASADTPTDVTSATNTSAGVWTGITLLENDAGNENNLLQMMSSFETVGQSLSIFA